MAILLILDIRRVAGSCDRKSHTEKSSALLELFRKKVASRFAILQSCSEMFSKMSDIRGYLNAFYHR
jgi:hypothetical protein